MYCGHFVKLMVASSVMGPKAPAGQTFVSMSELKVLEETNWNGTAGVSSSDSSMSDAVLLLPARTIDEAAARGGLEGATFPWGGPYAKNDRGCFLANFKPLRGNYAADQALYTVEADAYEPNEYNLFNMAGNVSEWTSSTYERDSYEFSSSINPSVSDNENNEDGLKVVRGGSWKDVSYYLQVSTRDFEKANVPRSYIGFRTVQDYLGTDVTANAATN